MATTPQTQMAIVSTVRVLVRKERFPGIGSMVLAGVLVACAIIGFVES